MFAIFFTWVGAGAEFLTVDSFHNFRYIQSVPEQSKESIFASWVDPALAVMLGQKKAGMTKDEEVQMPEF